MKNFKNINFELLIVVFLFLYFGFIFFSIALSNIFLGIGVLLFLFSWIRKNIQLDFDRSKIVLFLVLIIPFLLTMLSVLHSEDLANGMRSIRLRIPIPIVTFILIFMRIKHETIKNGFIVFTILTLTATLVTIFNASEFMGEGILLQPDFTSFITPIQHPYFGIYLLIALVSVIEFRLIKNDLLRYTVLLLLISGIVLSTSRLAYLLLFSTLIFYSFKFLSKKNSIIVMVSLAILSVLFISGNKNIQQKFKRTFEYHDSPRLKLWNNAIKVINNSENKLLGIGVGDYYNPKKDPYFFKENKTGLYGYDPHSQIFDFFITTGYFGLVILFGYFLIQVIWITKQNRFSVFIFIIISAFALTESILNRQYGVQLYSVMLPLIFSNKLKLSK